MKNLYQHKELYSAADLLHTLQKSFLTRRHWDKEHKQIVHSTNNEILHLQNNFKTDLTTIVTKVATQSIELNRAQNLSQRIFSKYYHLAFQLGLKHSGLGLSQHYINFNFKGQVPELSLQDNQWINYAVQEEQRYWAVFLKQITTNSLKRYNLSQRIDMYVSSILAQFDAGRIVGSPRHSFIYWIASPKETCPTCLYIESLSPIPKELVICQPKSGLTFCKTHCKCKIQIKPTTQEEYAIRKQNLPNKHQILLQIKTFSR